MSEQSSDLWRYRDTAWSESGDVIGYEVEATDGSIGTIDEATADTDRAHVVVDTGFWIFGKKRVIPAGLITSVDHHARLVTVSLSKDQVRAAPDYDSSWSDDDHARHSDYYEQYSVRGGEVEP